MVFRLWALCFFSLCYIKLLLFWIKFAPMIFKIKIRNRNINQDQDLEVVSLQNMQVKTPTFLWISLFSYYYSTRHRCKRQLASKHSFFTFMIIGLVSSFVFSSLRCIIKNRIANCLELFLHNNILSYICKYRCYSHPARFPSNIQYKYATNLILCFFAYFSSWRFVYCISHQKIPFWIRLCNCTSSCCNMIFCHKTNCNYD